MYRSDWVYLAMAILVTSVIVVILVVLLVVAVNPLARHSCDMLAAQNPHLEFRYTFWTGCLVQAPSGNWIDAGNMYLLENWED